jgi:hypothetical protein
MSRGGSRVPAKIQVLLIVLAMIVLAALKRLDALESVEPAAPDGGRRRRGPSCDICQHE